MRPAALALAAAAFASAPAAAQLAETAARTTARSAPFVFVQNVDQDGGPRLATAWWLLATVERPTGTEVAGIGLDRINQALARNQDRWCHAEALTLDAFVSPYREVQADIDAWRAEQDPSIFHLSGSFTNEGLLDARVGKFETCAGRIGAFILITDRSDPPGIVYVHAWSDWAGLIWMARTEDGPVVASCFECDHAWQLVWDRGERRFDWRDLSS